MCARGVTDPPETSFPPPVMPPHTQDVVGGRPTRGVQSARRSRDAPEDLGAVLAHAAPFSHRDDNALRVSPFTHGSDALARVRRTRGVAGTSADPRTLEGGRQGYADAAANLCVLPACTCAE